MFEALIEKFEVLASIDANQMVHDVLDDETLQAQMIDLNQSQLYDKGIQSDGTPTGNYAPITISFYKPLAASQGRDGRSDHITGKDTGETYSSMKAINGSEEITITADDRNAFFDREPEGLGLTDESMNQIIPEIRDRIIDAIKEKIAA